MSTLIYASVYRAGIRKRSKRLNGWHPSAAVAALSDNEARSVLENFESSEDFAVFVKPYLAGT